MLAEESRVVLCIYIYTWVDNRHVSISHPNNHPTSGNNLIVFLNMSLQGTLQGVMWRLVL